MVLFGLSLWSKLRGFFSSALAYLFDLFHSRKALLNQRPVGELIEDSEKVSTTEQHNVGPVSLLTIRRLPCPKAPDLAQADPPISYARTVRYIIVAGEWERKSNPQGCNETPELKPGEVLYISKGKYLGSGGTAFIELLPSGLVVKTPIPDPFCPISERDHRQNMRIEANIYQTIGSHTRVPTLFDWDPETCCLTMEYLENGNLREYIRQNGESITPQLRVQWAQQAAEALEVLHKVDVIHCDLSPRNFLLDSNLDLKISDFGGASIRGSYPSAVPTTRFKPGGYDYDATPVYADDIFSLGSLIFFIMTGSYPYQDVPSDEVERLYEINNFPDVSQLNCGPIITRCWHRQVDSAEAVYNYLISLEGMCPEE